MNIILVDDEKSALNSLKRALKAVAPNANVTQFLYADEALTYAKDNTIDVAFLDIEMSEMNGIFLAKALKDVNSKANIIFVTGYSQYALDAFWISASGYVMKPIDPQRVAMELENLRHPVQREDKGVRIQCFGNFEVFVDGTPIRFNRPKAKEALAYLVDRKGASISKKSLAVVLWEDKPYTRSLQSHLHKLIKEIERALSEANIHGLLVKSRALYYVDTSKFTCDYYSFEKGEASAINAYHGEYLSEYSWGEFTAGSLSRK